VIHLRFSDNAPLARQLSKKNQWQHPNINKQTRIKMLRGFLCLFRT
jgi:hypothetical protein